LQVDYSYFLPSGIQHEPFAFFENGTYAPVNPKNPANNSSTKLWVNGFYTVGENGISEIVEHEKQGGIGDVDYNSSQVGIQLVNKATNFIDNHLEQNKLNKQEKPFLLYFASQAIHEPHSTPLDFDGDATQINEKINGVTGGKTSDFLFELDFQVGKILQKLKDEGLDKNTIVIFTSDNGALWPYICDYGNKNHDNNGVFRDYKASVYEGGHRVPFIVKWPGEVKPNSISKEPIVAHDWVATMYELTGQNMEADQALDSSSLISLLKGTRNNNEPLHPFILYQAGFAFDGAIREGDWVLNVNRENNAVELFNLKNDLSQENNLIDIPNHNELISRLHAKFLKYNDHDKNTRDPRTTKVYKIAKK
jgi:arylsulfatase A-like enzyme